MRIGEGYDVHRMAAGRPCILGGILIPFEKGPLGHSDADVLTHAVMDALLGAAGLGDIGLWFPDNDDRYLNADSMELLGIIVSTLGEKGFRISNLDATLIAQRPKIGPYREAMRRRLAEVLDIAPERVNVKATTEEGLGFTGDGSGIAARAVCLLEELS